MSAWLQWTWGALCCHWESQSRAAHQMGWLVRAYEDKVAERHGCIWAATGKDHFHTHSLRWLVQDSLHLVLTATLSMLDVYIGHGHALGTCGAL